MTSTTKKPKEKKCKECGKLYQPSTPLQFVCSIFCATNRAYELNKKKREKKQSQETRKAKDLLLTKNELMKLAQVVFNKFIRLRDKEENCISCDTPMKGRKGDASHYYATTYTYLRFNEDNVHLSCVTCNQFKHGNLLEYTPRLINKIGEYRVQWLHHNRHNKLELSNDDLRDLIKLYKEKIKMLN